MLVSRLLPHLAPASVSCSGVSRLRVCGSCARTVGGLQLHTGFFTHAEKKVARRNVSVTKARDSRSSYRILSPIKRDPASLVPRPPVVAVMGHVDHGKTSLLDSLRQTAVAASEAGGITQHIGAFSVTLKSGSQLTFLDTPGHAAFSNMRARGANATDMVVLVVAADDGVKDQTKESINMINKAKVPMVVAINKCDKHKKDVARVRRELLQVGVELEEYGGEVQAVEISALKKEGLDALEEALSVLADLCEIRGDPSGPVQGVVIETRLDRGLGSTATIIVQHGTLNIGNILVTGNTWCRVKSMLNEKGGRVQSAPPSSPVLTTGWRALPAAGELCLQADSEQEAKISCKEFSLRSRSENSTISSFDTPSQNDDGVITVPLIVKGDVMGSVEALLDILRAHHPEGMKLNVVQSGVGSVSDGDLDMAKSTKGIILAFGVGHSKSIGSLAVKEEIKILSHDVIYKLLDILKEELESLLSPLEEEQVLGVACVTRVYKMRGSKPFTIGGSLVEEGRVLRNGLYKVLRRDEVVHRGTLSGMRSEKDNIDNAKRGTEVGFRFSKDFDFEEEDRVVCYKTVQVDQKLKWKLGF